MSSHEQHDKILNNLLQLNLMNHDEMTNQTDWQQNPRSNLKVHVLLDAASSQVVPLDIAQGPNIWHVGAHIDQLLKFFNYLKNEVRHFFGRANNDK